MTKRQDIPKRQTLEALLIPSCSAVARKIICQTLISTVASTVLETHHRLSKAIRL